MLLNEKPKEHSVSDEAMRTMFAARKAVFVDLLKWDVPVLAGQYEVDQFDDPHANYIILAEPDGNHLGSARLLPTTRPHILDSFYADLCDEAPPRAPDIVEITRFCLDRRLRAASGDRCATHW
jgi:acyl-homoserine lactone synthase